MRASGQMKDAVARDYKSCVTIMRRWAAAISPQINGFRGPIISENGTELLIGG